MKPEDKFISIRVSPYAILDLVTVLGSNGLTDFSVTKEDGDLVIRTSLKKLLSLKYNKIKRSFESNE